MSRTLTGAWTGVYFYPLHPVSNPDDLWPPVGFRADIVERGGRISGATTEPRDGGDLKAVIEGERHGSHVAFLKTPEGGRTPIAYEGSLTPNGNQIDGRWTIHSQWSGSFRMQRADVAAMPSVERETSA